jgi:formylglycine-generating enzyme required for sulfatase activity
MNARLIALGTTLAVPLLFQPMAARAAAPANTEMALVPGGSFAMGDTFGDGNVNELPVHQVAVSAFYMDRNLVTKAQWDQVYRWAISHGYRFDNTGLGKAPNHPVETVSWYDVVKWCNARSEMEGFKPCYFTDASRTVIYRDGQLDLNNPCVDWAAGGYRLPTEAEWEKAARGGAKGRRFPWPNSDTISQSQANYYSTGQPGYDVSPTRGYHPSFHEGAYPFTSPAGFFAPNGYGINNMAGNIWQWCWDWYDSGWYRHPEASQDDTRGPAESPESFGFRVMRGGAWHRAANFARCSHRGNDAPDLGWITFGFRSVRKP